MNFLRGAPPGDIHVEGELLRLGRRVAVCDMRVWTEAPDRLAAQASVTYAIPA
jgi:acyl-coenzyme A thioesterase PaaI-like protein